MKPNEHLPNIHGLRFTNHECVNGSDSEDHDTPSPMDNRKYQRGRSVISNKCSSHSSFLETPTKLPCIESNSRSVTSITSFQSAVSHLAPTNNDLSDRHRLCRSPSCPNLKIKVRAGDGSEEDFRLPSLRPKALSRHNTHNDINKMAESHRRMRNLQATTPRGGLPDSELESPSKYAMLLPLRDGAIVGQQHKTKVNENRVSSGSRKQKQDRKRRKKIPVQPQVDKNCAEDPDCCNDDLNLSQSDMKCLIWLAEVKASQSDLHEVT